MIWNSNRRFDNMKTVPPIEIESSWFYRLFNRGTTRLTANGQEVRLYRESGGPPASISLPTIAAITIRPQWLWNKLTFSLLDGTEHCIGGLSGRDAMLIRNSTEEESVSRAKELEESLKLLDDKLRQLLDGTHYVRHSDSRSIHKSLVSTVTACRGLVREHLERDARATLGRIEDLADLKRFEAERELANSVFVKETIPSIQSAAVLGGFGGLTNDQAAAVATDEDVTLVLAGAGTGKTAVITSKVAHLVRNEGVSPSEILVLAFNRKAAGEIRSRLVGVAVDDVFTFHGLGHRIIAHAKKAPTISNIADDQRSLLNTVHRIMNGLMGSDQQSDEAIDFIAYNSSPYQSPFTFRTLGEYYGYVRSAELRTLSGALVKSFEELEIANYLSLHGIEFRYEEPYVMATATKEHRQYKPDFYLPDYDIYIEHFALDKNGKPPPGWHGYAEGVSWKRLIHRQYGTRLVETYSWQHEEGLLRATLRKNLESAGVQFSRIPAQVLVDRFQRWLAGLISRLIQLLAAFLNHVKTSRLSSDELRRRAQSSSDPVRSEAFLNIFDLVKSRYETILAQKGGLDFHDLINLAIDLIHDGTCPKPYRYILVDEFQDISAGRMELLKALQKEDTVYFLVGDDWQSINRFAGSDVRLMQNCDAYLGYVRERVLSQTFRFGDGILKPSTDFVRQNPAQTQRSLHPNLRDDDHGITIIGASEQAKGLHTALEDIKRLSSGQGNAIPVVLVLGVTGTAHNCQEIPLL